MKYFSIILALLLSLTFIPTRHVTAGDSFPGRIFYTFNETDTPIISMIPTLIYFFDLRERETFIQLTFPDSLNLAGQGAEGATAHVQIFDVSNNCNENNFFDSYTFNDTHIYNMRDIQTNDGNPSGVNLPEGAYGIVAVTMYSTIGGQIFTLATPVGNLRIIDDNGYEYRTNAQAFWDFFDFVNDDNDDFLFYSFNFNQEGGVSLSDVVGITLFSVPDPQFNVEWLAQPVQAIFTPFDIDIVDNNETVFSCRDIIFSCVDENNPLLEELLAIAGTANVASFEYGINNAIPHSKGGELLCPGNNIGEGTVLLRVEAYPDTSEFADLIDSISPNFPIFVGYVGLNNGNGRGSLDSFWVFNIETLVD